MTDIGRLTGSRASTEPVARLGPSGFDPERMAVLDNLRDEWIYPIAKIAADSGVPLAQTRRILKELRADGLAEFGPCYDEDEYFMRGSGYTRSDAGSRLVAEYASAIEAGTAETTEIGSVHESAAPKADAQGGPNA